MARLSIPVNEVNAFDLPPVCLLTGATTDVSFQPVKFSWYPRWIALFAPLALLPVAILAWILTRRVAGQMPFSTGAYARWRRGKLLFTLSLFGMIVILIGGSAVMVSATSDEALGAFFLAILGAIALPIVVWAVTLRGRDVKVVEISKTHLTVEIPNAEVAQRVTRHLLSGERRSPPDVAPAPVRPSGSAVPPPVRRIG